MSGVIEGLTKTFNDHALKIGLAGGALSTLGFRSVGFVLMAASGIALYNRHEKNKPIWTDAPAP